MGGLFGSKVPDTSGQNAAAQTQADIAQQMWNQYKTTYLPLENQYVADAQNYDTPEHREAAAAAANADVTQSFGAQKDQAARQMDSYGITPDSGKFQSINNRLNLGQAAQQAASQTAARRQVEQTGWDRRTGALSLGKGLPATASSAASGAATSFGGAANTELAGANALGNDVAGMVGGGAALYNSFKPAAAAAPASASSWSPVSSDPGWGYGAAGSTGGYVDAKRGIVPHGIKPELVVHHRPIVIVDRGGVRHLAYGGPVGALNMARQGSAGAPAGAPGQGIMNSMIQGATMGKNLYNAGSSIAGKIHAMQNAPDMGFNPGLGGGAADEAISGSTADIGAGAGDIAGAAGAGTAAGAEAAAGTGLSEAALGTGAAALGETATAAIAPEALAALLLLNKGGAVLDGIAGGGIHGPGSTTSDSIPARLSDGEFVLNAEAVKHFGVDKLEKMNEVGLQKRYGIRR